MKPARRSILSMLDDTVRWTGLPARIAAQMSAFPPDDRKHRRLRWLPIWPIAISCALFILALAPPSALDVFSPGAFIAISGGFMGSLLALAPGIYTNGPLGKSSFDDDEREAVLRKDSFLFSYRTLFALNSLGLPVLLILSHWQDWHILHAVSVAVSSLLLNAMLLGCLPTLYASWNLRELTKE
jgi:hypothetical protein